MRLYQLPPIDEARPPAAGDEVDLPAGESRHLIKVMRAHAGDEVLLTDGRGRRLTATLLDTRGPAARLRIETCELDQAELQSPRLWLACGMVKGRHFEWALEKAVELGVHAVQPLLTSRSEIASRTGRYERWRTIMAGAAKQSGRAWLPDLSPPANLADWLSGWRGGGLYYGVARARDRSWRDDGAGLLSPGGLFARADGAAAVDGDLAWVVGPEGGWDVSELAALALKGLPVRLGPHRLRTETAACAGLTLLAAVREMLLDAEPAPGA